MRIINGVETLTVEDMQEVLLGYPPDMPIIVYGDPLEERDIRVVEKWYPQGSWDSYNTIEVLVIG